LVVLKESERMLQSSAPGRRGYTMIEMATTLVVAGIVTTVGIVTLAPAVEHGKVRSAVNVVAGDLQYAQALAVRERRPISVVVDSTQLRLVIRDRDAPSTVHRTRNLGSASDFALDRISATGSSVELFPNGVAGSSITLTLGLRGYERRVRLTRAGQIRIIQIP
jgi:prepilin-type N-terminal cleavage/methylation domain-containing protein